jgi:hypothetical protein
MTSKPEEYLAKLEKFFSGLSVTGSYFCAAQYERWRDLVRHTFEDARGSTKTKGQKASSTDGR